MRINIYIYIYIYIIIIKLTLFIYILEISNKSAFFLSQDMKQNPIHGTDNFVLNSMKQWPPITFS